MSKENTLVEAYVQDVRERLQDARVSGAVARGACLAGGAVVVFVLADSALSTTALPPLAAAITFVMGVAWIYNNRKVRVLEKALQTQAVLSLEIK